MTRAKTATNTDKDVIAVINGLEIRKDSLYKVVHKLDKSAPDGFQKEGATKLPSEGIADSVPCRFRVTNPSTKAGIYDTGFYESSPCYIGMDKTKQREIINNLKRNIVTPYEEIHGDNILSHLNLEFWDSFSVKIEEGRVFSTENIDDLLELYIAVQSFELTPINMDASPQFKESNYIVEDSNASISVKKKRNVLKFSATSNFMMLLTNNKEKLLTMLVYLNAIRPNTKYRDEDLTDAFSIWLEKDVQNSELFVALFEKADSEEGWLEITLTVIAKNKILSNKLSKSGSQYVYNDMEIGIDARSIAHNLMTNIELVEIKDEFLGVI